MWPFCVVYWVFNKLHIPVVLSRYPKLIFSITGLSNLSAMVGRIDFILGMAGQYAISAAIKAMFECDFVNVLIYNWYKD